MHVWALEGGLWADHLSSALTSVKLQVALEYQLLEASLLWADVQRYGAQDGLASGSAG